MRGIFVALAGLVADMDLLEQVCMIFLDSLPTVNQSRVSHQNRVLGIGRGDGGCIVVVPCLVNFFTARGKLLDYLWIDRLFLLGESRHGKADCQPYLVVSRY